MQGSSEFIGGLALTPSEKHVLAATGDGSLKLLDLRKACAVIGQVSCGSPSLCCQTDGQTAAAGGQDGQVNNVKSLSTHNIRVTFVMSGIVLIPSMHGNVMIFTMHGTVRAYVF